MKKKNTIYRQCGLRRDMGFERTSNQVSYIPARFAILNKVVRLKQADGQWEDGWKVINVGTEMCENELPDSRRQIKSHRARTGDSLRRSH